MEEAALFRGRQRVVKSTIAAETLAMVKATAMSSYLAFILKEILLHNNDQLNIPTECYIDNHFLWDGIHSTKQVSEKHLQIDLGSLQMMLEKKEITRVIWVESSYQLLDCLTKRGACSRKLLETLEQGFLDA